MKHSHSFLYYVFDSNDKFLGVFSSLSIARRNFCPGYYIVRRDSFGNVPDKKFIYD